VAKRQKKIQNNSFPEHKFYVHYNDDGTILSVNNFRNDAYSLAIEITLEQHHRLVAGLEQFTDFRVGTIIDDKGNPSIGLIPTRIIEEHNFKNRLLKWIDKDCHDSDIDIHWDEFNDRWIFVASDVFRQKYYDNKLPISDLTLFLTLGKDPNFLIKTFSIDLKKITYDKIIVPFETKWEKNIDEIAITTNLASINYALKIWRIHE